MIEVAGKKPLVEPVRVAPDYGKFVVEPLPHGFGVTLGNALRRALLSSVPGVAITDAKIEGVAHEFTKLPGVREDMTEFILNLKGVAFQVVQPQAIALEQEYRWRARIEAEGQCEVTAADVVVEGSEIKVVNPELHLATLTADTARLNVELAIRTGVGYVASDKHDVTQLPLGTVPVDSLFTPVQRVNHVVESTRVGHLTDLDRLILEIWTNGAETPSRALSSAAEILDGYFRLFFDVSTEPLQEAGERLRAGAEDGPRREVLDAKIEELDFSVRTYNCLKKENINTIGELVTLTRKALMEIRNLGQKSLEEINAKLDERGLTLVDDEA
ncbi:MAG: DNA-directed RNA polymerase subunit alpha [Fimbriimonadaceae bacterium]|nr:DNA-directed RNA polymerase subunit alpha [Fimbriimonadaceae bacterium]